MLKFIIVVVSFFMSASLPAQLLISEVFESNGGGAKYIELHNPTSSTVVLNSSTQWQLHLKEFGVPVTKVINLSGTIAPNDFFVIGTAAVDILFGPGTLDQTSADITHDGDDTYTIRTAIITNKGDVTTIVDSFASDLHVVEKKGGSFFANDVVAHRVADELPNDGSWRAISPTKNLLKVASPSGFWETTALSTSDANAATVATPGAGGGASGAELPVELESFSIE